MCNRKPALQHHLKSSIHVKAVQGCPYLGELRGIIRPAHQAFIPRLTYISEVLNISKQLPVLPDPSPGYQTKYQQVIGLIPIGQLLGALVRIIKRKLPPKPGKKIIVTFFMLQN